MRISTSQLYNLGVGTIQPQYADLQKLQQQMGTGQRMLTPADDPIASAQALDVSQSINTNQQYTTNAGNAYDTLSQQESILGQVNSVLQNVRDTIVSAQNSTLSDSARANLASTVKSYYDQLLGLANSTNSNGQYIFAGNRGSTVPFTQLSTGNVTYNGDQGQMKLQISPSWQVPVSTSGAQVFQQISSGNGTFVTAASGSNTGTGVVDAGSVQNQASWAGSDKNYQIKFTSPTTYDVIDNVSSATVVSGAAFTSGGSITIPGAGVQFTISGSPAAGDVFSVTPSSNNQDIFSTLGALITTLNTSASTPTSQAALFNGLGSAMSNLDSAQANVLSVRSNAGTMMNEVTAQKTTLSDLSIQYQGTLGNLQNLDYAQAASDFSMKQVSLTAAQKSFVQVQGLSLFNYINP